VAESKGFEHGAAGAGMQCRRPLEAHPSTAWTTASDQYWGARRQV